MRRALRFTVPVVAVWLLGWTAAAGQATRAPATKPGSGAVTQAAARTETGVVRARAADSLTVNADDGKDWIFAIDSGTKVVGKGVDAKAAAEHKTSITDVVFLGDAVSVSYTEKDGKMRAALVRVTAKYEERFR